MDLVFKMIKIFVYCCCAVLIFHPGYAKAAECPRNWKMTLGISDPPVESVEQRDLTKEHMDGLGVRHLRFSENWKDREPQQGIYQWSSLDSKMKFVQENWYSLFLTIEANGPDWACSSVRSEQSCVFQNNQDLKNYVEALLRRYPGKISKLQFGNEMLLEKSYAGSAEDYVAAQRIVYQAAKEHSPSTKVVLGGFSAGTIGRFVVCEGRRKFPIYHKGEVVKESAQLCSEPWVVKESAGVKKILEQAQFDAIDLHLFYDVQYWEHYADHFKQMVPDVQMIVSEFGGPMIKLCNVNFLKCTMGLVEIEKNYSDQYHSQRILDYLLTLNRSSIDEAYYFRLVEMDNRRMYTKSGLLSSKYEIKSGYNMFQEMNLCPQKIN